MTTKNRSIWKVSNDPLTWSYSILIEVSVKKPSFSDSETFFKFNFPVTVCSLGLNNNNHDNHST